MNYYTCTSKFFDAVANGEDVKDLKDLAITNLEKYCFDLAVKSQNEVEPFNIKYDIAEEFDKLMGRYCKSSGKSDTVFGEIVRGIAKLAYREMNDGDDVCVGPYSGIWYGLQYEFDCPFTYDDYAIYWHDYDFDSFNIFYPWNKQVKSYGNALALGCLILENIEEFKNKPNRVDIADYYKNIVNYAFDESILDIFKSHNINLTTNIGTYGSIKDLQTHYYSINSIYEDFYLRIDGDTFKFEWNFIKMSCKRSELNEFLSKYGKAWQYFIELATNSKTYKLHYSNIQFEEPLKSLGFKINNNILEVLN